MQERSVRKQMASRLTALKTERSSWDSHWRSIAEVLLPRSGRWLAQDRNRGGNKSNEILDSEGTQSLNIMASGMMAGATSPARRWFRLGTDDPELQNEHSVRAWLDDVGLLMMRVFGKSNVYQTLRGIYEELGAFGTAAAIVLPRPGKVIHLSSLTVGEYWIAQDEWSAVNTLYREFDMSVDQLVREFGIDAVTDATRTAWKSGRLDQWVTVVHGIEPRDSREEGMADARNMPWRSVYFEANAKSEQVLRESGFSRFPGLAPRWAVTGGDVYGRGPGMDVFGDVAQLQHQAWRKGQAIDYQTQQALQAPMSMAGQEQNLLPGSVTYVDSASPSGGVRPLWESRLDLSDLREDMQLTRARIRSGFFADLFLMLASSDRRQMTAAEVAERHEEKLLMLGPVLERLHNELLAPLVEITFDYMLEAGMLPPAPPELDDRELGVEFVSMLAQAQRAIGVNAVDRFLGTMHVLAQGGHPEVLDRIAPDKLVDGYADMHGVDPDYLVPVEEAEQKRAARNQALAAKEQAAAMQQQAATVKDLASSPVGGGQPNALDAIPMLTGYGVPQQ